MRQAVQRNGVHTRINGPHLKQVARGRITLDHAAHILAHQRPPGGARSVLFHAEPCARECTVRGEKGTRESRKNLRNSSGVASRLAHMAWLRIRASTRSVSASSSNTIPNRP